nr:hypothetical protein [Amycolatopsis sp. FDAARGOS 1241]
MLLSSPVADPAVQRGRRLEFTVPDVDPAA